jgi:hypothetical protein
MVQEAVRRDAGKCHICLHFGAKSADHLVPVTENPARALDMANLRAVHGYPAACPECSAAAARSGGKLVYCNEIRGMGSIDRARRIIGERTGLSLSGGEAARESAEGRDIW